MVAKIINYHGRKYLPRILKVEDRYDDGTPEKCVFVTEEIMEEEKEGEFIQCFVLSSDLVKSNDQ